MWIIYRGFEWEICLFYLYGFIVILLEKFVKEYFSEIEMVLFLFLILKGKIKILF